MRTAKRILLGAFALAATIGGLPDVIDFAPKHLDMRRLGGGAVACLACGAVSVLTMFYLFYLAWEMRRDQENAPAAHAFRVKVVWLTALASAGLMTAGLGSFVSSPSIRSWLVCGLLISVAIGILTGLVFRRPSDDPAPPRVIDHPPAIAALIVAALLIGSGFAVPALTDGSALRVTTDGVVGRESASGGNKRGEGADGDQTDDNGASGNGGDGGNKHAGTSGASDHCMFTAGAGAHEAERDAMAAAALHAAPEWGCLQEVEPNPDGSYTQGFEKADAFITGWKGAAGLAGDKYAAHLRRDLPPGEGPSVGSIGGLPTNPFECWTAGDVQPVLDDAQRVVRLAARRNIVKTKKPLITHSPIEIHPALLDEYRREWLDAGSPPVPIAESRFDFGRHAETQQFEINPGPHSSTMILIDSGQHEDRFAFTFGDLLAACAAS